MVAEERWSLGEEEEWGKFRRGKEGDGDGEELTDCEWLKATVALVDGSLGGDLG